MNNNNFNDEKNEKRYCDYFNMNAKEFQEYKDFKQISVLIYIVAMIGSTIFVDRINAWVTLTAIFWLYRSHCSKCEEQWIKDGVLKKEDLQ